MGDLQAFTIEKFLGLNKSETETLLKLGEASNMKNWVITDDNKISKMFGYQQIFDSMGAHKINGMWYGKINGVSHFLFACNGHMYEHNLTLKTNTDLGTIADSFPTTIFANNNTVYILDGTEFYKWTGSGSVVTVQGYAPIVATGSPPTGGGTLLESVNYINGQKGQKFSGTGSATVYQLLETNITAVNSVKVGGVLKTSGVDYSVNLTNGTITFVTAPATGANNVEIFWTKTDATSRALIANCRLYGGIFYSRLWFYGNQNHKNTRYVSGITMAGVSDPEYWPMFADSDVGEYEITGMCTQYDQQIIFTSGDSSEASAWYSTAEVYADSNGGIVTTIFPVKPMNAKIGNVAPGQVQIILNNPLTIWKGIYEWQSTYVMNEKNAKWISKRIQSDLDAIDLSAAITYDWNEKGYYFVCVGNRIWVLNYRVSGNGEDGGAWFYLEFPNSPTCFCAIEKDLYFGTADGTIMKFGTSIATYNGTTIDSEWEMGYNNFGTEWITKFVQECFITILPYTTTHVDIYVSTDRKAAYQLVGTVSYRLSGFDTWDFSNFSFETNYSPQPFRRKVRAKKIDYIKIRLVSNGTDGATVLSVTLPTRMGGRVKNRS